MIQLLGYGESIDRNGPSSSGSMIWSLSLVQDNGLCLRERFARLACGGLRWSSIAGFMMWLVVAGIIRAFQSFHQAESWCQLRRHAHHFKTTDKREGENQQKGKGGPDADVVDFLFATLLFPFSFFWLNFQICLCRGVFYTRL